MNFDEYIQKWNGQQIERFGGECVAGIAEYEAENNLPIVWGDAHTWISNPTMLSVYDWVANNPNDPNQLPLRGDIVVWPLPNEHIAFFDHNLDNHQFMSFGQNSGGPTMHFQPHSWANVAGWYTPKQNVPVPVENPFTIETITPKQVKLNKNTHLWGLNYDNFTAINTNPQADAVAGTILTVRAILHHNIGYTYYLTDPNVACGYNVVDCDDYSPPPPEPYKPPAGPMVIPNNETYDVIKDVGGFLTSNQAVNHIDERVVVPVGTYFIFNKRYDTDNPKELLALNLTKTPGKPGAWISVADNVETPPEPEQPEPVPEPEPVVEPVPAAPDFRDTYKPLVGVDGLPKAQVYVAMRDTPVVDFGGVGKTVKMPKYSVTYISGTFVVNDVEYARPKTAEDKNLWYGIEWVDPETNLANIELESDVFNNKTTIAERQFTKSLKAVDRLALAAAHLRKYYLNFLDTLGKMSLARKNKKQKENI